MVFGRDHGDAEMARGVGLVQLHDVGGAGGRHDGAAFPVIDCAEVGRPSWTQTGWRSGNGVGERDLPLALDVVGGRPAFEVNHSVGHEQNARDRHYRVHFSFQIRQLQLCLHGIDHLHADVGRIIHRPLLAVEAGERNGRVAHSQRDRADFLDLVECASPVLGMAASGRTRIAAAKQTKRMTALRRGAIPAHCGRGTETTAISRRRGESTECAKPQCRRRPGAPPVRARFRRR